MEKAIGLLGEAISVIQNNLAQIQVAQGTATSSNYSAENNYGGQGTDDVYTEDYLENFVGTEIQGAGNPDLNQLMEQLQFGDTMTRSEIEAIISQIAAIRGVDSNALLADYDKMVQIMEERGLEFDVIDQSKHGDFMGSISSLRYGQVVGDAIGLDPVFGALMNPSGGLVGPGNSALDLDTENAITYHGIFHDAAGYLYNNLDIGPGYDYVEDIDGAPFFLNDFLNDDNPLAGQWNGIAYWESILHDNAVSGTLGTIGDFTDLITTGVNAGLDGAGNWVSDNVPFVGGFLGWNLDVTGDLIELGGDGIDYLTDIGADGIDYLADLGGDGIDYLAGLGADGIDYIGDAAGDLWEAGGDLGGSILEGGADLLGGAVDAISNWF